jgi:hypothetical protein
MGHAQVTVQQALGFGLEFGKHLRLVVLGLVWTHGRSSASRILVPRNTRRTGSAGQNPTVA